MQGDSGLYIRKGKGVLASRSLFHFAVLQSHFSQMCLTYITSHKALVNLEKPSHDHD